MEVSIRRGSSMPISICATGATLTGRLVAKAGGGGGGVCAFFCWCCTFSRFVLDSSDEVVLFAVGRTPECVLLCCSMLSLRVKALLHSGQTASFFPVCFFACRAAWPEVVKNSLQPYCLETGQGYEFFFCEVLGAVFVG